MGIVDIRKQVGHNLVTDGRDYNMRQNVGDVLSIIGGAAEAISGAGVLTAGLTAESASGRPLPAAAVPLTLVGAIKVVHGVDTATRGATNLVNKKGRVSEMGRSSAGRGKGERG